MATSCDISGSSVYIELQEFIKKERIIKTDKNNLDFFITDQ